MKRDSRLVLSQVAVEEITIPNELIHELPTLPVHRRQERPDEGEHEHGFDALLEVLGCLRGLFDDAFERPEFLEVAVQDVHQALDQAPVHLKDQTAAARRQYQCR